MTTTKYPNESVEYRKARNALLEEEKALIAKVKDVAALRRALPPGGTLTKDYTFLGANDHNLGVETRFSKLFGAKETLLIYSYMFGPDWDYPCPSCTSLIDGFDRAAISVNQSAAFAVVAKAGATQLNAWAKRRHWKNIAFWSAQQSDYLRDYLCEVGESSSSLLPIMHVFRKQGGTIHHFWASEMQGNHVDLVWPYWNLMDMTPEGRPNQPTPPQDFHSQFLEKNYLSKN